MDTSHINNLVSGLTPNAALIISGIIAGIIAIIGAVIGGIITGRFMMRQNRDNHQHDSNKINEEENRLEKAVLQALETEIKVIWERYGEHIKPWVGELQRLSSDNNARFTDFRNIEEDKRYFIELLSSKTSISQDYFTIYKGTSSFIGKIKNDKLREKIVSTYTNTKGMVDEILLFSLFQDNMKNSIREIREFGGDNTRNAKFESQVLEQYKKHLGELADYTSKVKVEQDRLETQIGELLKLLEIKNQDNH
jgi:hypothetical protein